MSVKLSPYVLKWNVYGQINDGYKPRSVAYEHRVQLSRGMITVLRKGHSTGDLLPTEGISFVTSANHVLHSTGNTRGS